MPTGCAEGGSPVDPVTGVVVRRIRVTGMEETGDEVAQEYPCSILCQGQRLTTLMCTPEYLDELALGFLHSQGLIASLTDVEDVAVEMGTGAGRVEVSLAEAVRARWSGRAFPQVVFTSCGQAPGSESTLPTPMVDEGFRIGLAAPLVGEGFRIGADTIWELMRHLLHAPLHSLTGGTHAAALATASGDAAASGDKGGILCLREDVGRHNAVDKVIGWWLKTSSPPAVPGGDPAASWGDPAVVPTGGEAAAVDKVLLTTGRLSSDMVMKASRLRVPVLVSRAAPTGLGVRLAYLRGITLVGFARGERLNVYTHPERVYWRD